MNLRKLWKNEYFKTILMLVIVLLSVFVFWFGSRAILATEYPFLAVATPSMVPTLNVGDLIIVQGISNFSEVHVAPYGTSNPGDIIVFHSPKKPGDLIVHRAIYKFNINGTWYFKTKGDHNTVADNWNLPNGTRLPEGAVPQQYVVGKVIYVIPWIGYIALKIKTPIGFFIIALLFFLLIAVEFIFPLFSEKQETETTEKENSDTSIYKGYINY